MDQELPAAVDALVIGGGPAGLSAALWLGRYRRHTLVVDSGHQRNLPAALAHGVPGRDPVPPAELLADLRAGLEPYPDVRLAAGTVTEVCGDVERGFTAVVDGRHEVAAARVVIATGVGDRLPGLEGLSAHYGLDVHHCPACDGFEVRGRDVVVLGDGPQVPAFASELLDWAATVRIVTDAAGAAFEEGQRRTLAEHGIEVVDGRAAALAGAPGELSGVVLADGTVVPGAAVFFSYAHRPANALARALGCDLDEDGQVLVDGFQLTSVPGVYAAGDLAPGLQLVAIAMGQGVAAGIACATSLRGGRSTGSAPRPAPPTSRFAAGR
ncbi:NAD(P)/FAD-dependent oxidoreductase [Citricoccus sp. SGAir0253]|uniref:NAD(P)/FAD-dependent oxidoreductase n=1 Tax=Citricoccus sp. SGAir0253 TaxID=2567881 RepID=UPI0010CCB908|nr:NAD(P)/FAD-dependent oxidoreductase [Citricoccus sp. SGAir0253]QCU78716.1 NAD(P)/FAD-dependent oxidoreductase [Citricoccus sp. SGAir0253]